LLEREWNMKRSLGILAVILVLAVPLTAEPVGLTVGTKIATGDLLDASGFSVKVKPYLDAVIGSTGFCVGADWDMTLYTFDLGTFEAYEEYDFSAAGFDFAAGNFNSLYIPGSSFYGCIYGTAAYGLPIGLTPKVEIDFNYYAWWSVDGYFFLIYKTDLGPGKLGAEARLYAPVAPSFSLDSTRIRVNYTMPVGPVNVKGEVEPTIAFSDPIGVKLSAAIYVSMDL
jgi:hypothetical protein